MNISKQVLTGTLGLLLSATIAQADTKVVPGVRIGNAKLGASRTATRKALGAPSKTFNLGSGLTSDLWRSKTGKSSEGKLYTFEVVYRKGVAVQIEATSPRFSGPDALSTDSSYESITRSYPKLKRRSYTAPRTKSQGDTVYPDTHYYDDTAHGLAWEFITYDDETMEGERPHTIIVHRRGYRVLPDKGLKPAGY